MSKTEFEKARDERSQKFQDAEFELNPNGVKVAPYVNSTFIMECFDQGADWAYEWLEKNDIKVADGYVEQLDQQAKIIAELKGAFKEELEYHEALCIEGSICSCEEVHDHLIKTLAKVEEMESKTP